MNLGKLLLIGAMALLASNVALAFSSSKNEDDEVESDIEDKKTKEQKKARKKEVKALYGIDMTDVTEIDIRSGYSRIDNNVLFYDTIANRPFVTKGKLVIGKQSGHINKLMRTVDYKEVRLDNFDANAITSIRANDASGFSFNSNIDMPNAVNERY